MKNFWQILVKLAFFLVNYCEKKASTNLNKATTLTLGLYKTPQDYREALEAEGFKISGSADLILEKILIAARKTRIRLISKTNAELGLPNGATRQESYDRGLELGYFLCPAEVGPALRLAYPNQPEGEWLRVAMEPIDCLDGYQIVFNVGYNDDDRWFSTGYVFHSDRFDANARWVFSLGTKALWEKGLWRFLKALFS